MCLRATAVTLGVLAGCASDRATPTPSTPLPSLAPIVVTVTTTTATTAVVVPQPVASPALLTDVYGQPLETGVTYTVPPPPTTTAPHPSAPPPKTSPPVQNTAPLTTDCPRKKHRRHCKP
jgi:hypothetical protein